MIYSTIANQKQYPFILPELPFDKNDLSPYLTSETFDYHYAKHHQAYVTNLNKLLELNQDLHSKTLEEIIIWSNDNNKAIFNNAAQVWNHTFFWHSMQKGGGGKPDGIILDHIIKDFGSFDAFIIKFQEVALTQFGSGWAWLVKNQSNKLEIIKTGNADTPITQDMKPIINCDVWEHSYYINYYNRRPDYVSDFLKHLINWDFASKNFQE